MSSSPRDHAIAITGMAGRFPGAAGVAELWRLLDEQRDAVTDYTEAELLAAGAGPGLIRHPDHVPSGAHLAGAGLFDADFFGFTDHEAQATDPQRRILLDICHEALEQSGHGPGTFDGRTGVFTGLRRSDYAALLGREPLDGSGDPAAGIARRLGLTGPVVTVPDDGPASLVAVHLACRHLLAGDCDMALAGGAALRLPQHTGYLCSEGSGLARSGRCRPFDAGGDGVLPGDGAAVVVLRRLADALADGDDVLAVVRGSAMTVEEGTGEDGTGRAGPTAAHAGAQVRAVREALKAAGVEATDLSYIEAHGAGTPLGDPAEFAGLTEAFGTGRRGICALGSVKSNVGHLDAAAGVTGLIKTVLALHHGVLPGTPHFLRLHPGLDLVNSPFYIAAEPLPWDPGPGGRIAGVNALGSDGTHVHVVVGEPPAAPASSGTEIRQHLFVWSAHSAEALESATSDLRRYLEDHADTEPADVAFTLQNGRRAHHYRRAVLAESCGAAAAAVRARAWLSAPPASLPPSLRAPAEAWLRGAAVDWTGMYAGESRRRLRLPTHPMRRRHHWPAGAVTGPGTL
ncbi:beta-ketoacyl synthase N-terminal-like domain-containing protein [Streptomyces sp. NBC_00838]|uniref:beta-ketoacyl synthase N-terminal-like domain-containing protein n=1 Tax=Streptomyces sp. NBC_00838 TaxID=2903680 RepID=UPI003863809F|nr:beta-ketoacyl synthase N-terminal-like domain-containing protein [Streptomyces sp. NBC_00838]